MRQNITNTDGFHSASVNLRVVTLIVSYLVLLQLSIASSAAAREVTIGVLAFQPKSLTSQKWTALGDYLEKEIPGLSFRILPLKNEELEKAIAKEQLDYVLTNPCQYIYFKKQYSLSAPLATVIRGSEENPISFFAGAIYTLVESTGIVTLEDLKGKKVAVPFMHAFGAFQMQQYELFKAKLPLLKKEQLLITGMPHDRTLFALLEGKVDVAFGRAGTLERLVSQGKVLDGKVKLIAPREVEELPVGISTSNYPEWPVAALPHVEKAEQKKMVVALMSLDEGVSGGLPFAVRGFIPPTDYSSVEGLMRTLRVPPFDVVPQVTLADLWNLYRVQIFLFGTAILIIFLLGVYLVVSRQQLNSSEKRFKALHNASFGGIGIHDNGVILDCNQGLSDLTGYSLDELIGMNGLKLITDSHREEVLQNIQKGYDEPYEAIGVRKNGEEYPLRLEGRNMPYNQGQVRVTEFRDMTEEKKAEAERDLLQEQLRQAQKMEAVGTLAGGVAHDFNNVLGGILGASELLGIHLSGDEKCTKYHAIINQSALRAAELTEQLLTFSRRSPKCSSAVNLHQVIEETLALVKSTVDKRIRIETELGAQESTVRGDSSILQSMILNLCINGAHAMPEGGLLEIRTRIITIFGNEAEYSGFDLAAATYLETTLSDSGEGIAPEYLPKIFDPFFTTKKQGQGTGLGLASVYGAVQQHNGGIKVSSQNGEGTVFTIVLPLSTEGAIEAHPAVNDLQGSGKILVVDDEEAMRTTARDILEILGYEVMTASNGKMAVDLFKRSLQEKNEPALVLLDMIMPEMNGRDCLLELRRLAPKIKVILSSGFTRKEDLEEMMKNGLDGYLRKPYNLAALGTSVLDALTSDSK